MHVYRIASVVEYAEAVAVAALMPAVVPSVLAAVMAAEAVVPAVLAIASERGTGDAGGGCEHGERDQPLASPSESSSASVVIERHEELLLSSFDGSNHSLFAIGSDRGTH